MPQTIANSASAQLRKSIANAEIEPFVYCYPPRTAYSPEEAPTDLRDIWCLDAEGSADLNIYIHIPFCKYRCSFCALYTITTPAPDEALYRAYVESVQRDLAFLAPHLRGRRVRTVFIGGGTPLAIGISRLVELLTSLEDVFPGWRDCAEEVCVEASPDSVLAVAHEIHRLVEAGVNRINVGVQSFDDEEIELAGRSAARRHVVHRCFEALRTAGIANSGLDLIVGLEAQTDASLARSLDELLKIAPETASLYMINPRSGTPLGRRGGLARSENGHLYKRMAAASERLRDAGYVRESSVQFKLPGKGGLLQKQLYFEGVSVLGLGAGARSYTQTLDYLTGGGPRTRAGLADYIDRPASALAIRSGIQLDSEERTRRAIILRLHKLPLALIPRDAAGVMAEPFRSVFETCLELGLLRVDTSNLTLTETGFLYRELICWSLFSDEVLRRHSVNGARLGHGQPRGVAATSV